MSAARHAAEAAATAQEQLLLSQVTTMRVGGPAEQVLVATSNRELRERVLELWGGGDDWLLLGGGSNTVVCDEGFPGTVLLVRSTGVDRVIDRDARPGVVRLRVQAGQDWDELVAFCVDQGWAGVEALSGIPGLAGAAPVQNIGAYGAELSEVLHSVEFLDAETGEVQRLSAADLELGYRDSAIKRGREGVVLSIDLALEDRSGDELPLSAPIAYAQLANALGVPVGESVPLRVLRDAVLRLRASKGMVLDAEDHDTWSAGSFFTNPIVTEQFARGLPPEAPRFPVEGAEPPPTVISLDELASGALLHAPRPAPPRRVKLSAAWLIEHSGISKGFRLPGSGAAISSKHTLAITNRGGATADEVAQLARLVVQRVQQDFGIILAPEPNLYGLEL